MEEVNPYRMPLDLMPQVHVYLHFDRAEAMKSILDATGEHGRFEDADGQVYIMVNGGVLKAWVLVEAEAEGNELASLLAHEAVHIAQDYMDMLGEERPGIEHMAYLVQCILLELLEMADEARHG
jgi:hypothetical protein